MFKVAFFLWRRADFDRERFINYYEHQHAVLSMRIIPQPLDFRRNYPLWDQAQLSGSEPCVFAMEPFDVMTELFHTDQSGFQAQVSTVTRSPAKELMAEDELNFLNRNQQVLLIFDELGGRGESSPTAAAAKLVRYVRRAPDLSVEKFRQVYEKEGAPPMSKLRGVLEYRRNYPLFDHPMSYAGNWHTQGRPDRQVFPLDLYEEFWLSDSADVPGMRNLLSQPQSIIDPQTTRTVRVEELRSNLGKQMAPVAGRASST
jgi:hypothetical protein